MRQLFAALMLLLFASSTALAAIPTLSSRKVGTGFSEPTFIMAIPGDNARLFIGEQHTGQIRILNLSDGTIAATPFLTIPGVTQGSEQGLLGFAFDPNYATNGFFYINATFNGGGAAGHTEVDRYTALGNPATATAADPNSKVLVLQFDQPEQNHNAGWLGFGPDGFLYIATGDGGGANDQHGTIGNAQDRSVLLGKMLRINVATLPYTIPADNPFASSGSFAKEIWLFGLRNPWRCSFDRGTGNLWIGDVGQDTREEIDFAPAGVSGLNFGWRPREGKIQNPAIPNETPVTAAVEPVVDYDHSIGVNAIIGGYVYRGSAIPGLQGTYIHADYGSAKFWAFNYDGTTLSNFQEITGEVNPNNMAPSISTFGEGGSAELYFADYTNGSIYLIVGPLQISPAALQPGSVGVSYSTLFTATGGAAPYTWSVSAGALPDGVTLSSAGVFSGTPTAAATFSFTVTVTDSSGATSAMAYSLTINSSSNGGNTGGNTGGTTNVLPLTITRIQGNLRLNATAHDTVSIAGIIPNLPAGFNPSAQTVSLSINGADAAFTLNAHGHATNNQGAFTLQLKRKRGVFGGGNANFAARLKNGSFVTAFGVNPNTSTTRQTIQLTTDLVLQGQPYESKDTAAYSARAGKTATLRK